ncbi:TonB-dependent receptor [Altericroceibacterium spongiae]|uniref:TonB-dependent receptor n=1 Tax=Altericroceibacterium spongiae TaxID=2320269 RepID=A0A420EA60_9SPHN|nr:TonB-dependent receptor [Altericroceibacterium spongiae]RKF17555.1 TonB-dependent receptor [Altericroceibacterium spongiae]
MHFGVRNLRSRKNGRILAVSLLASVASAGLIAPTSALAQSGVEAEATDFDIPPRALSEALADFGRQSGMQVNVDADDIRNQSSPGVSGRMTNAEALGRLLAGTGLTWRMRDGFVTLEPVPQAASSGDGAIQLGTLRVEGQNGSGGRGGSSSGGAAGGADEIFVAPRAVSIVTREGMERTPARHAADLIAEVPGVTSAVNRLNPGLSVNIRGMQDFGRVNMMIDGMRQNFVQNGHQGRNGQMYVDPELVTSVTIERGPRAGVHGMGAIAGSVDFRTIGPEHILDGDDDRIGTRLRATTGLGADGNGVNFLGSAALAGRLTDNLEVIAAYSRRDIGDYDIGKHGDDGLLAFSLVGVNGTETISRIKYASQLQESALAKARLTLDDHQFQFSYVGTWIDYENTSDMRSSSADEPWAHLGSSDIASENIAFDYSWTPDSDWIDLNLKLYYVNTRNGNYADANTPAGLEALVDIAWNGGYCEREEIPSSWVTACGYGYGTDQRLRTRTYGVQLDNTSRFDLGHDLILTANYGAEFYQDRAHSDVTIDREGRIIDTYNQYGRGDTLNPRGRRSMGGLFANFEVENELFTLGAGLRYDRYWLKGSTQVLGVTSIYEDKTERFRRHYCGYPELYPNTVPRWPEACNAIASSSDAETEAWIRANMPDWYTTTNNNARPRWLDLRDFYEYRVDRSKGRFLPSIFAAIRPTTWLELYGRWGKSWRPPAINESLMVGGHPGDPIANMFPNPSADPEKTTTWELGANLTFDGIFKNDDIFFAKVGYFNTRAKDYLFTSVNNNLPGDNADTPVGLGRTMFVNNRTPMRFQGFEIEARYDAGFFYAGTAATLYTGKDNSFTQDLYPVGVGTSKWDRLNEDGSLTEQAQMAQDAGYPSWQAWAEAQVVTGSVFNSIAGALIDKVIVNAGIRLFDRKLDTGVRFTHSGSGRLIPWDEDYDGVLWPSYDRLDWYGSFTLNDRFQFFASVENVTDQRYIDGKSDFLAMVAAPGRTITGGIQMQF